ncbi:pyridoxamine 5'-phosphate oxidase [Aliidiomarina sp. Khilg15.8]
MKLDQIRREYQRQQLERAHMHADPIVQFEQWFDVAKLAELSSDPTAMVVATAADGRVSQRIVLLKAFDAEGFVFYTNLASKKAMQLQSNPACSLHFGWLPLEQQVMIEGQAEYLTNEQNEAYFHSRPRASQIAAWASAQSQPVTDREALDAQYSDREQEFADQEVIPLPPFWGGVRVRPEYMEFWQGRASRLHDRFGYTRTGNSWQLERLQP